MLSPQEQIFDICGEEVNLYLAGVNRLEILEIGNWKVVGKLQQKIGNKNIGNWKVVGKFKINFFRRLSTAAAYRVEDDEDGPAY